MNCFCVYPLFHVNSNRFRSGKVKEIIAEVLKRKLSDKQYHADSTSALTKEVSDEIKLRLKGRLTLNKSVFDEREL